ncbi:hypothetical protein [Streptomyces sp.]|uniref:hypothetical protein n=1 Tax=Streptomyces sp. TaxID=1931 RepID=UPI002D765AED|nr:hypothetical protein [Streptomyces sp.]HET6352889.1 hypothetical protein [Streptomyces sp.]
MRLSQKDFAPLIPVSDRMIRHWETGGENVVPRPAKQAALDTLLARAGTDTQERFALLITQRAAEQGTRKPNSSMYLSNITAQDEPVRCM